MSTDSADRSAPDRRDFLKTAGALTAGAAMFQTLEGLALALPGTSEQALVAASWAVRPFGAHRR